MVGSVPSVCIQEYTQVFPTFIGEKSPIIAALQKEQMMNANRNILIPIATPFLFNKMLRLFIKNLHAVSTLS